jgi:MEMO1 family protein
MRDEHPLVELARAAIEGFVRDGETIASPPELTLEMTERAGAFVSLHRHDQLRGCIGTFLPTESNVALEIIQNAISAATRDPRFDPLQPSELEDLDISVDLLAEPEPIESMDQLDPVRYGVIVRSGMRRGLLLPNLDGVDTVEQQVSIAKQKAWIGPHEACDLLRFEVRRFGHH